MPFPLATLAATITTSGITAPPYSDIYQSLIASVQAIYGPDSYVDPDSQDGQLLAIVAKAISDANDMAIAVYNSFRPSASVGVPLSSLVKINGISRNLPSNSQVDVVIVGVVGTTITNGKVRDTQGHLWSLPPSVVVPLAGTITVTATCDTEGAIEAAVGTMTSIATPTQGWQTVTNVDVASPGAPVESDAALRRRQSQSTARPAKTVLAAIVGAIQELSGVTQVVIYENDTNVTDANGIPGHSIAAVVIGGDVNEIATAIMLRKTPGAYTYGDTSAVVTDSVGVAHTIRFFVPAAIPINVKVTVRALDGYTSGTTDLIKQSIVDYINDLPIGQDVFLLRIALPAQFNGGPGSELFELQEVLISQYPATPIASDVTIAFNARPSCVVGHVNVVVV